MSVFETLASSDKLKYACSYLIEAKFLSAMKWISRGGMRTKDRSGLFSYCMANLTAISDRLEPVGYEVIVSPDRDYLQCIPTTLASNENPSRVKFKSFETKLLIGLRILYDRSKKNIGMYGTVDSSTAELISLLTLEYPVIEKEPKISSVASALSLFERCSILSKPSGSWSDPNTEFAILPCIKAIVSPEAQAEYTQSYSASIDNDEAAFDAIVNGEELPSERQV